MMIRPLLLAALLVAPALAQKPAARPVAKPAVSPRLKAEFAASDTNKDGVLTRAEVNARIARMDVGRSRLSPAQVQDLAAVWFARADANGDGRITPAEMQRLLTATAKRYDTNGDGVVSLAEREAARAKTLQEVQGAPASSAARKDR